MGHAKIAPGVIVHPDPAPKPSIGGMVLAQTLPLPRTAHPWRRRVPPQRRQQSNIRRRPPGPLPHRLLGPSRTPTSPAAPPPPTAPARGAPGGSSRPVIPAPSASDTGPADGTAKSRRPNVLRESFPSRCSRIPFPVEFLGPSCP
jgi:hypothetical protein